SKDHSNRGGSGIPGLNISRDVWCRGSRVRYPRISIARVSLSLPSSVASTARPSVAPAEDSDPRRWQMLALLACAELLGMSLWFAASAVSAQLGDRWQLSSSSLGWLTAVVQLGFVIGTAVSALLNLADILPSRLLFSVSALLGALANGAVALTPSYRGVL